MSEPKKLNMAGLLERLRTPAGITDAELQERDRRDHESQQRALLPLRLMDWGVGRREREAVLNQADWVETQASKHARWLAANPSVQSMVLWGGAGCGKSVAAVLWLTLAARRRFAGHPRLGDSWSWDERAKFISPGDIARRYGSFVAEDRHWADDVRRCSALVLDDLGAGRQDIGPHIADIVYERNRHELRTVITTNLTPQEFAAKYDTRAADRLQQDGFFRGCGSDNLRRAG